MVSKSAVNTQCIHHWDVGQPNDGIVHCVCKLCGAEKDLPAFGGKEIEKNVRHRYGIEAAEFNKRTIRELDIRDIHVERKESAVKTHHTKQELNARREEFIAVWEKNERNVLQASIELRIGYSTLACKLQQWGLLPSPPSRQHKERKNKSTITVQHRGKGGQSLAIKELEELQSQLQTELDNTLRTVNQLKKRIGNISTAVSLLMKLGQDCEGGDVK